MVTQLHSASAFLCSCFQILTALLFLYAVVPALSWPPLPRGQGFLTALSMSAHFPPTFWFSFPPPPHPIGFQFKWNLKEVLCDWPIIIQETLTHGAELLHQPISLATGHSRYGCLWVRPQCSVQSAVARKGSGLPASQEDWS